MNTGLIKKALWILFGCCFIKAIDSIIIALAYLMFHQILENNYYFSSKVKDCVFFSILGLYFIVFAIAGFYIYRKARLQHYKAKENVPVFAFFATLFIAITLNPLTLYISNNKTETQLNDLSKTEYMSSVNLTNLSEFLTHSIYISKWTTFTVFSTYLFILLFKINKK